MVVADTEYSHRAMGDILPLRDAFVSVFFVSLGMLFDVRVVASQPLLVVGLLAGFLLAKGLLATLGGDGHALSVARGVAGGRGPGAVR